MSRPEFFNDQHVLNMTVFRPGYWVHQVEVRTRTTHQDATSMPTQPLRITMLILAALLLGGCATRFDIGAAEQRITPQQAANDVRLAGNKTIAWGGIIVAARNLASQSQLEVLSYPLDKNGRPQQEAKAGGRFIALHPGYLELANYAEGRFVTMTGTVSGTRAGSVGEAHYVYPVLAIKTLFLWPTPEEEAAKPQFHFGVGVGIGH
jgi:outer membrane lipoprotein